jgi:hypothetical protein
MSTVYQLAENVKQYAEIRKCKLRRRREQYAEIKALNQKRNLRRRSEQYEDQSSEGKTQYKSRMKIKAQKEERIAEVSLGLMEILRSRPMHRKR